MWSNRDSLCIFVKFNEDAVLLLPVQHNCQLQLMHFNLSYICTFVKLQVYIMNDIMYNHSLQYLLRAYFGYVIYSRRKFPLYERNQYVLKPTQCSTKLPKWITDVTKSTDKCQQFLKYPNTLFRNIPRIDVSLMYSHQGHP